MNFRIWTVVICTTTGDHISQNYSGNDAQRKARRAFKAIDPVEAAGIHAVELRHGGKHGLLEDNKSLSI